MKNQRVIYGLLMGMLILTGRYLSGQRSPFDPRLLPEAARIREQVDCFTDRTLYITDEVVRFSARVHTSGLTDRRPWSTVLYVELAAADGSKAVSGKFPVRKQFSSGEIRIPAGLLSGTYYLRCYTRWMRNRGPEAYSYVPLRIINPNRSELVREVPPTEATTRLSPLDGNREMLSFKAHPLHYRSGDTITMQIFSSGWDIQDSIRGCLTVVPHSSKPSVHLRKAERPDLDSEADFQLNFLPDRYGPSLSGFVRYPGVAGEDIPETRIHLTLMGNTPDYYVCRSDASGRFTMALPANKGKLELFVQPESTSAGRPEVRIDQEFDQRQLLFPAPLLVLSEEEKQRATIMARNVQLSRIYQGPAPAEDTAAAVAVTSFYGTPTISVDMDEYVLLPTLEEVFFNLVPGVTPVIRRKQLSLLISSENPALSMYEPLFMVDHVPVFDMGLFMSISPKKINRIDVIDDVYIKGNLRFGGIINLHSLEKDMAGIDLPANSFFIEYMAMHPPVVSGKDSVSSEDKMPDTRNTLLWLPDLVVEKAAPTTFSFIAPDYPGEYVVLFRGLGAGEELISVESTYIIPSHLNK